MVCAPVRSIIPSLKLGDYLSVQVHKPCSISHLSRRCLETEGVAIDRLCLQHANALSHLCIGVSCSCAYTGDPRYKNSFCYQRLCCYIEFVVVNNLIWTRQKHE